MTGGGTGENMTDMVIEIGGGMMTIIEGGAAAGNTVGTGIGHLCCRPFGMKLFSQ